MELSSNQSLSGEIAKDFPLAASLHGGFKMKAQHFLLGYSFTMREQDELY